MGDCHQARCSGERWTERFVVVDLQVAEVDRDAGALVDRRSRRAHGLIGSVNTT